MFLLLLHQQNHSEFLDLNRPDILQLPNEVECADKAGQVCEDKNNKQQKFWLKRGNIGSCNGQSVR